MAALRQWRSSSPTPHARVVNLDSVALVLASEGHQCLKRRINGHGSRGRLLLMLMLRV
jgi:hypothetical protein